MTKRTYQKPTVATLVVAETPLLTASGADESVHTEVIEQEGVSPPQGWSPGL